MRTWKQLICGLLGTTLCAGLLGAVPAAAAMTTENATEDDSGVAVDTSGDAAYDVFTYRENDIGVTITSCDTSATAANLPEEIDGKPVTEIGDAAFMNCQFLTSLTIPSHVTKIGESAFSDCPMLCTVSLPEGLREL